ncbi:nicotinate-nucleotide--dimethylbenzimidazole phosphoribosyltransferase [Oceanospirillum maris]|uniref:nicotinate-nucleotide--dimethylbenzimidazole phosphoribosyltransferase n=1 Tax=Oceanospirillum maris TaxID=64977 RepID=UPI000404A4D0|nr:nicotinate-nucleotide--dimethylbenzimidazole phosphoribosyltransferase [Oceanospirillum maris]
MFSIFRTDKRLTAELQAKIDTKTKPLGALGQLEDVALKVGLIQQSLEPVLNKPHMLVFAGDHGIVEEGVSPFPQEVTPQMVLNFLNGGAAINVFCRQNNINLEVVNAGVASDLPEHPKLFDACIAKGTQSYLTKAAMTDEQVKSAFIRGGEQVKRVAKGGCNVIGFGEMGIGNTSSAALLMHRITGVPLVECVGRGTGLDEKGVLKKLSILQQAAANHPDDHNPLHTLARFGGFEIAMICGAMLKAAELKMLVLIDGFIATSALLVAHALYPEVLDYCVFTHQSDESGHRHMLNYLNVQPLLQLDLRLGEGSGVAVAYPLVASSVAFLNEMASFADAGVSTDED